MNHIYRLVWNAITACWVAVCETAKGRGKGSLKGAVKRGSVNAATAASLLAVLTPLAQAQLTANTLPTGSQVVQGSASVSAPAVIAGRNTLNINQQSQQAILNWNTFNIGSNGTVNFQQPNASAVALNRVTTGGGSEIYGQLNANGNVFLVNPNGVLFGAGAQVNVGGLVASTMDISDADFAAGGRSKRYVFNSYSRINPLGYSSISTSNTASNAGKVTNLGHITAATGGSVVLLGQTVTNEGVIAARLGSVALAAGSGATLEFAGNRLIKLQVDAAAVNTLVANAGTIKADGGWVLMNAQTAAGLARAVVNHSGIIEAQTVADLQGNFKEGKVEILADFNNGTAIASGTVDASAPNGGNGGFVETSAAKVKIASSFRVTTNAPTGKTGTWLIDPTDFVIAATGGDISGATLSTALGNNNVAYTSADGTGGVNGDVLVNDTVTWSSANSLSLTANRNIDFTGGGSLNGSNASSQVNLTAGTAGTGQIIGGSGVAVTAGTLVATAQTGIGSSTTPLLTQVQNLALQNATSGGIYVTNTGDVTVAARSTNGDVVISTADGADGTAPGVAGQRGGSMTVGTVAGLVGITVGDAGNTGSGGVTLLAGRGGKGADDLGVNGLFEQNGPNATGAAGGAGGAITINTAVSSAQTATVTAGDGGAGGRGAGGRGGDGASGGGGRGGMGGMGGAVTVNAALTSLNANLSTGRGGIGGTATGGSGGNGGILRGGGGGADGGAGGAGGTFTLNAGVTAAQSATLQAGSGGLGGAATGGNSTAPSSRFSGGTGNGGAGGAGGAVVLAANVTAPQNVLIYSGSGGAGGAGQGGQGTDTIPAGNGNGGAGGNGGTITVSTAFMFANVAALTAGDGGDGGAGTGGDAPRGVGDGFSTLGGGKDGNGGAGGAGGSIIVTGPLTARLNLSVVAGDGGVGGDGFRGDGEVQGFATGGVGGSGGNVTLNAPLNAGGSLYVEVSGGRKGGSSNSSVEFAANGDDGQITGNNIMLTAGDRLNTSTITPTSGTVTLQAANGIASTVDGPLIVQGTADVLWRNTTIGSVDLQTGGRLIANGNSNVSSLRGVAESDVVLNGTVTSTDSIVLASTEGNFVNNAGANALQAGTNWVVYSNAPQNNVFGGLQSGNAAVWGTAYDVDAAVPGGNRYAFSSGQRATAAFLVANNGVKTAGNVFTTFGYTLLANNAGAAYGNAFTDSGPALTITNGAPLLASNGAPASAAAGTYAITADLTGVQVSGGVGGNVTVRPGVLTVQAAPPGPAPAPASTADASPSAGSTGSINAAAQATIDSVAGQTRALNLASDGSPSAMAVAALVNTKRAKSPAALFSVEGDGVNMGEP